MSDVLNSLRVFFTSLDENKTCWIAYSGGLDSQVLLSLCHQLRPEIKMNIRAIHINHWISPYAPMWARHCQQTCASYGMDYEERTIKLNFQKGESLEERAREKRYAAFADCLAEGDVLLTAHHQDDQAETVLLQLLRGAGTKGLAAMPAIKSFAKGYHARPLLSFSRADLKEVAKEHALTWVEDESNQYFNLARNFIRHEILSRLKSYWPSASACISRSAAHCAENQTLLETFSGNLRVEGSREHTLSVSKLLQLSPDMQRLVLRTWIDQAGYLLPDTKKISAIQQNVLLASWDSMPIVQWGEVMLRRHRDDLFLVPVRKNKEVMQASYSWNILQELMLPSLGRLKTLAVQGAGLRSDITHVSVCFRQGGEMVELPGRGRHCLKNLFQEWNVLPWERDSTPLIYVADKLIAVAGFFLHADCAVKVGEVGREILFERGSFYAIQYASR